jgi:cell division septation protein DedD
MNNITNTINEKTADENTQTPTAAQTTAPTAATQTATPTAAEPTPTTALLDISVDNENIALNVIVGMLNIAQKRGAFSLAESSKTWECVQMFMKSPASE